MAKKREEYPHDGDHPIRKTVILDQVGTGEVWAWEDREDGRLCSGEPVSHNRETESSFQHLWRNRFKDV